MYFFGKISYFIGHLFTKIIFCVIVVAKFRGCIMNLDISTNERIQKLQQLRESGEYNVASLEMFDAIKELEMTDRLYSQVEFTKERFYLFLEELLDLTNKKPGLLEYLKSIRNADVLDNQKMEQENSFLIGLYSQLSRETMMGRLIKYAKSEKVLTGKDLFSLHTTLLNGTLSEGIGSMRTDNATFVGGHVNGDVYIDYFPIDYKDIKEAADKIVDIYNNKLDGELYNNVFLQPFLLHGLLAALQLFKDGNTRTARVMQHALLWRMLSSQTEYAFDSPPIFATRNYFPFREEYRRRINDLVTLDNNNSWENWFIFNLYRIQDAIVVSSHNIEEMKNFDYVRSLKRDR